MTGYYYPHFFEVKHFKSVYKYDILFLLSIKIRII